jgi:hypothetical protein
VDADNGRIVLLRKNLRTRLWVGGSAVALFVATLAFANGVLAPGAAPASSRIGLDFLPFYAAGTFVREARPAAMYDIDALRTRERAIAAANGLALGEGFGPFWNPPFFALPFALLAGLPFRAALGVWMGINFAALGIAIALLCRMLARSDLSGSSDGAGRADWRTWGLVPLLAVSSVPFLLAVTHGQNTFCSLLLLTCAVLAWRSRRAILAGLFVGLLAYKPQLAALVGVVALIDLGWPVFAGAALSGGLMLLAAVLTMPGIAATYRTSLPRLLQFMQVEHVYLWERHVTLKAFWRLLLQGHAAGEVAISVTLLASLCAATLLVALLVAAFRCRWQRKRGHREYPSLLASGHMIASANILNVPFSLGRDRLIAATVVTMPLVMPFYFDYDLLLLAIPAVLVAAGGRAFIAGRARTLLVGAWSALFVWMIVNPDVAELTRINGAVPLLGIVAAVLVTRALRRDVETTQCRRDGLAIGLPIDPSSLRRAA